VFLWPAFFLFPEVSIAQKKIPPFISPEASRWADSIMSKLTPDQRVGQLFMIAAFSNRDSTHVNDIQYQIANYGIGGGGFFFFWAGVDGAGIIKKKKIF
jgi:hypothetical protein